MSKKKLAGIIVGGITAIIVLVVIFTRLSTPAAPHGLNVTGGIYLVYQPDLSQVPVSSQAQVMEEVRDVIEKRINNWGVTKSIVQIETQEGCYNISIQLPGVSDIEGAKAMIERTGLLEVREQVLNATGNTTWVIAKALGSDGTEEELTGKYLKPNATVQMDPQTNKPVVAFEWNSEGAILFEQITTRNLNKPLGIFLDNELISAPTVQAVIESKGVITGVSLADAQELCLLLNAGTMPVSLGRWVEQGDSKVFEANVPLYEELVTPP